MKCIKINFSHPFKGWASLIQLNTAEPKNYDLDK